jgi:hypothetical protein
LKDTGETAFGPVPASSSNKTDEGEAIAPVSETRSLETEHTDVSRDRATSASSAEPHPIAPSIIVTDTAIVPERMTIRAETTVVIRNTGTLTHRIKISDQEPSEPVVPVDEGHFVYLPLVVCDDSSQSQSQLTSQSTAATTSTNVLFTLLPGEEAQHTFDAEGLFYVFDIDDLSLKSVVTVEPDVNRVPRSYPVTVTLGMNKHAEINLAFEATSDPDDDILSFSLPDHPPHGTTTLITDTVIYTPTADYVGEDRVRYQANDGHGGQVEGYITFNVLAPTQPPLASDRIITLARGESQTLDLNMLVHNPEEHSLTYVLALDGEYGVANVAGTTLTYQQTIIPDEIPTQNCEDVDDVYCPDPMLPTGTFTDTVIYAVTNDQDEWVEGNIVIRVVPEKLDLVANDRVVPLYVNESTTVDLATLVDHPEGEALSFGLQNTLPISFDVQLNGQTLSFTPPIDYTGVAGLTYVVTDTRAVSATGMILFDVQMSFVPDYQVNTHRPIQLLIEPQSAMLTHIGDSQTFTLHAYNGNGEEVVLDGDITWITVTQDLSQTLRIDRNPSDPTLITVTNKATIGYAQIKALWGGIPSRSATLTSVELRPGAVTVPDSAVREEIEFRLPPDLEALPTLSERLKWLRDQGEDYVLPLQYRTLLDLSQIDDSLQVGTLVASSGSQPIFGEVISTTLRDNGMEVIYETVPITDVVAHMRLKAEYGTEDVLGNGDLAVLPSLQNVQELQLRNHVADQGTNLAFSFYRSFDGGFAKTTGKIKIGGCYVEFYMSSNFKFVVDLKISKLSESYFDMSIASKQIFGTELGCRFNGRLQERIYAEKKLPLDIPPIPIPSVPFLAIMVNISIGPEISMTFDKSGEMGFGIKREVPCHLNVSVSTRGKSTQDPNSIGCESSVPKPFELRGFGGGGSVKAEIGVSLDIGVGVPTKKVYLTLAKFGFSKRHLVKLRKRFEFDIKSGVEFKRALSFSIEYRNDQDIGNIGYGTGSYGIESKYTLESYAKLKLKLLLLKTWFADFGFDIGGEVRTKPLSYLEWKRGYPEGIGISEEPQDKQDRPDDICTKENYWETPYEDENITITCKKETTECSEGEGRLTQYYRKEEPKGNAERSFTFEEKGGWIDHITDLKVVLIGEEIRENETCKYEKTSKPKPVGNVSGEGSKWRWTWEDIPEGHYKLAAFTIPKWFFDGFHFHLNKDRDIFEVKIGDPCRDEDEDTWELVDTEDECTGSWTPTGNSSSIVRKKFRTPQPLLEYFSRRWGVWGGGGDLVLWGLGCGYGDCTPWRAVSSWGDPHNTTFDGASYDSLYLGEFIYARDTIDPDQGMLLQVRQGRLPGFPDWAVFNTAVALRADGHIFEVRLPEEDSNDSDLQFLLDGEVASMLPGSYQVGDANLLVRSGNELTIWTHVPDLAEQESGATTSMVRVDISREAEDLTGATTDPAVSLKVSLAWPDGTVPAWHGLFGKADPDPLNADERAAYLFNDFSDQDGNNVGLVAESGQEMDYFHQSWCISDTTQSLFLDQNTEYRDCPLAGDFPTLEDLEQGGYIQQAKDLLTNECGVDVAAVEERDPNFIPAIALELMAGRTRENLKASGLCTDGTVKPSDVDLIGFHLTGQVTLDGHPEVNVPGARVVIRAGEPEQQTLCDTTTVAFGEYECGLTDYLEPYTGGNEYADQLTLHYEVQSPGEVVSQVVTVTQLITSGAQIDHEQNLTARPGVVLNLHGRLLGPDGLPLPHGKIRTTSPAYTSYTADEQGTYDFYLALPDDIGDTVNVVYEAASADMSMYALLDTTYTLTTTTGVVEIEQDIKTEVRDVDDEGSILFTGVIQNQIAPEQVYSRTIHVTIQADELEGGECNTITDDQGRYTCRTRIVTPTAFTARVNLSYGHPYVFGWRKLFDIGVFDTYVTDDDMVNRTHTRDFLISPTTLHFTGAIYDTANEPVANILVGIDVFDDTLFDWAFDVTHDQDGTYSTYVNLPPDVTEGEIEYEVSLDNGTYTPVITTTFSDIMTGTLVEINKDFKHFLVLKGTVQNLDGINLSDSTVWITDTTTQQLLCNDATHYGDSYECRVLVDSRVPLVLEYRAAGKWGSYTTQKTIEASDIAPGGIYINDLSVPATVILVLDGQVINALLPDNTTMDLDGSVTVSHADGELCSSSFYSAHDEYGCVISPVDLPVVITYTVSGDWGSESFPGITIDAADLVNGTFTKDLEISPTTLHLTGIVTDALGQPVESSWVRVRFIGYEGSGTTNSEGQYSFYIVLDEGVTGGDIVYNVDSSHIEKTLDTTIAAHELNEVVNDLQYIKFEGDIQHSLLSNQDLNELGTLAVTITNQLDDTLLCTVETSDGGYLCGGEFDGVFPLTVQYTVSGEWGSTSIDNVEITESDIGAYNSFVNDLVVSPTLLHLTGVIRDASGNLFSGERVPVQGDVISNWGYTDDQGRYDFYVTVKEGFATGGTLSYNEWPYDRVDDTFGSLTPDSINEFPNDLSVITFMGQISSSCFMCTDFHLHITSNGDVLCYDSVRGIPGNYSCSNFYLGSSFPYETVNYEVDWYFSDWYHMGTDVLQDVQVDNIQDGVFTKDIDFDSIP